LSFDIAGLELYLPLVTGAKVVLAGEETAADPRRLSSLLVGSGATVMQATPTTWRRPAALAASATDAPIRPVPTTASRRTSISSGYPHRMAAMPRYLIVRSFEVNEDAMPNVGRRSREVAEQEFPEITWEHSHVVVDDSGLVRTFCVYEAPDVESLTLHATRLGKHEIDSLDEIAGDVTPADFPPA